MNTRLASGALTIGLLCSPIAIQECYAAAVYNQLNTPIQVVGGGILGSIQGALGSAANGGKPPQSQFPSVAVGPKQRTGGIEWTTVNDVIVSSPGGHLCSVDFGAHAQIQGGNYLAVSPAQKGAHCVVYDSNQHPIVGQ